MEIAICDDEKEIRELLRDKVKKIYPTANISLYASGIELLEHNEKADIVFLDIQMPDKNGMETAEDLRRQGKNAILIFVTAAEDYVFRAFDVGAFHYLVKPFTDEKFETVLRNAVEQYQKLDNVMQAWKEEQYIMIKTGGVNRKVQISKIIYVEVFNRKVMIHSVDGEIEYYGRLSDLEMQLGEDFFRPHRAYLVNFKYIVKYDASAIYLDRGMALMAKKKYPEFVKKYLKYNQRKGKIRQV